MVTPEDALPGRETPLRVPDRHAVLGTPLQPPFPEGLEQLVVGMGCFWGAERVFWQADGVYTTAVGYAGGYTPNPTYEEVCSGRTGHTEAVLVVFDPAVLLARRSPPPVLGEPRPDAGAAPGERRRHAVPLGRLLRRTMRSGRRWRRRARCSRPSSRARATARSRPRSPQRGRSTTPRLPPAVPRQEPERLLRPRWHGRLLPGRPSRLVGASPRIDARSVVPRPASARRQADGPVGAFDLTGPRSQC